MKNIVIIPAWQRADFLGACLAYIGRTINFDRNKYIIMLDRGYSDEVERVAVKWGYADVVKQKPHTFHGNSFNVLEGYRRAVTIAEPDDLIHLIEEDVFVSAGHFEFHRMAWETCQDAFFVTSCYNQNGFRPKDQDPTIIYPFKSYQSLGVSFKPDRVKQFLVHHTTQYHRNFGSYLARVFGNVAMGTEQDGMIQRVIRSVYGFGIYPAKPRAFHAGFRGYNRKGQHLDPATPIGERVKILMSMTDQEMNDRAANPAHKDIERCQMDNFEPKSLTLRHDLH